MDYNLLGEGSYGCVFKPSLPCSTPPGSKNISYKNKISKLMLTKDSLKEVEEYTIINRVDPKGDYYTGNPIRCTLKESPDVERAIKKCKLAKNKTMKQISQDSSLLIIGDGGLDLEKWVRNVVRKKNVGQINDFWREMVRLFRGLQVFKTYDLVHHDLKPQNIVFREETKRANFIDFGLMRSIKSEAAKCREVASCKGGSHWNYPTEVIFMNKKEFSLLAKQSVLERQSTFERYMSDIRNRSTTPFVNAFSIMTSYIFKKEDIERRKTFTDKYMMAWKELLLSIRQDNYDEFLNKTIVGFDVFGFGLTFIYVLSRVQQFMKPAVVKQLDELFFKMMTPNIFIRLTIEQASAEYSKIISGL